MLFSVIVQLVSFALPDSKNTAPPFPELPGGAFVAWSEYFGPAKPPGGQMFQKKVERSMVVVTPLWATAPPLPEAPPRPPTSYRCT